MASLLLAVIYLSYISLGLPDSLLGAAWPAMQPQLGVPVSCAGILSMIVSCGTVISSLLSGRLLRRFRTGTVSVCSVLLTAAALAGFSCAGSFPVLCCFAVPYGLGAGAVDAALNHYAAVHYPARHLNWLHSFWGIGCMLSPYIISIRMHTGWQSGFRTVAVLQIILTAILFLSLPLWQKTEPEQASSVNPLPLLKQKSICCSLCGFFSECALESTAGLWASSFLVRYCGISAKTAAGAGALFYCGITLGRLAAGLIPERVSDRRMIRAGLCISAAGILLLILPSPCALCGLFVIGCGCAPVYPCRLHALPEQFPDADPQTLIGLHIAGSSLGMTLMPPLFGMLAEQTGFRLFPAYLLTFLVITACAAGSPLKKMRMKHDRNKPAHTPGISDRGL
ncbi:MAG: MFS transporter [Oscillospiraceae bacterium]|nr:MFS transporter [Oscillospiraceae bacterium]